MIDPRFSTAAILAGGRSRRMGFDKFKIQVNGQSLLEVLATTLGQIFQDILIVANTDDIDRPHRTTLIRDDYPGLGPMAGIQAALKHAESDYVYVMACDMPRISLDYIGKLKAMLLEHPAEVGCFRNGEILEPFHAFYSKQAELKIAQQLRNGQLKAQLVLSRLSCRVVTPGDLSPLTDVEDLFLNMNTPDELAGFLKNPGGGGHHAQDSRD